MKDFLAFSGAVWWLVALVAAALVARSLLLERADNKDRAREKEDREQAEHVRRFGSCRAAGTLQLHNANASSAAVRTASEASLRPEPRAESLANNLLEFNRHA